MRWPGLGPLVADMPPPWLLRLAGRFAPASSHAPAGAAGPVFERDADLAQALADHVGLLEQRLLHRVVLGGDLLGLGAQVVAHVDEELHQTGHELVIAAELLLLWRFPEETEDVTQL